MKYLILFLIKIYQKTLSPDHGIFKNYLTIYKWGAAKRTAKEISKELSRVFARQGWIAADKAAK